MRRPDSAEQERDGLPGTRRACIDIPAFPLQLLLRDHPDWAAHPVAVVADDRPQGLVLWANEEARRRRVLPGMRYASALALAGGLRASPVGEDAIDARVTALAATLRRFTPHVEPARAEPGIFWLDASGLVRLHPDLRLWATEILAALAAEGFRAFAAVGFTRFGAYAAARALVARGARVSGETRVVDAARAAASSEPLLLRDPDHEARAVRRVPLDRLGLVPETRDLLAKLGVRTVDHFLALPATGIAERFGADAARLHRLALRSSSACDEEEPLSPEAAPEPLRVDVVLEHPERDAQRLLFLLKRLVDVLLPRAADRRQAVAAVALHLRLDDGGAREDVLRTAAPTLDPAQILDLLRLRLEAVRLSSGATDVGLVLEGVPASPEQLRLFAETPKRDLAAADRALARIRAEFGDGAVVRARLRDGHLAEAAFSWEPLAHAALPRPRSASRPPLVRRLFERPLPLPPRQRHEPDGWLLRGLEYGPVVRFQGPYVVAGGWWAGPPGATEVRREYHFAETSRGHLFWVFYDVRRRRWFLQAEVS